jgi:hypothetical protein
MGYRALPVSTAFKSAKAWTSFFIVLDRGLKIQAGSDRAEILRSLRRMPFKPQDDGPLTHTRG